MARNYVNNAPTTTTTGALTSASTSITVASLTGYPSSAPYTATLGFGGLSAEVVLVTAIAGSTVTVTRGYDGTTAVSHPSGETFDFTVVARDYGTTDVHGIATGSQVVGTTDSQVLTNKIVPPPSYSNEAAATGAGANYNGNIVYLTASTGGVVTSGPFIYQSGAWQPLVTSPVSGLVAMDSGVVIITPVANTPTSATISFKAGRFASGVVPNVTLGINAAVPGTVVTGVGVTGITNTGATVWVTRTNTSNTGVYWIATYTD